MRLILPKPNDNIKNNSNIKYTYLVQVKNKLGKNN